MIASECVAYLDHFLLLLDVPSKLAPISGRSTTPAGAFQLVVQCSGRAVPRLLAAPCRAAPFWPCRAVRCHDVSNLDQAGSVAVRSRRPGLTNRLVGSARLLTAGKPSTDAAQSIGSRASSCGLRSCCAVRSCRKDCRLRGQKLAAPWILRRIPAYLGPCRAVSRRAFGPCRAVPRRATSTFGRTRRCGHRTTCGSA